jgi:DNA-binding MarR family transcriptional regulator
MTAHAKLVARLDASLQEMHAISLADYEVLVRLAQSSDDGMRMCDLAQQLNLSPSGLTRRLDGLVSAGWVDRIRCSLDRRVSYAVLLPAGREQVSGAAKDHVDNIRRFFVDLLSREQLAEIAAALEPVVTGPWPYL